MNIRGNVTCDNAWKQNEIVYTREGYNLSDEIAHIRNQCNYCFYVPVNFANSETSQAKLSLPIAVSL